MVLQPYLYLLGVIGSGKLHRVARSSRIARFSCLAMVSMHSSPRATPLARSKNLREGQEIMTDQPMLMRFRDNGDAQEHQRYAPCQPQGNALGFARRKIPALKGR